MNYIRQNIKFVFILILPVYLFIVENSILNKHTHVYSNGLIITHSHPLDSESDGPVNHDHTKSEINLTCGLNIDFHLAPELSYITVVIPSQLEIRKSESEKIFYKLHDSRFIPRGPPTFQIF